MTYTTLITPAQLADQLTNPDWAIIDCRFDLANTEAGRQAYLQAHIPGAIYAHLDTDLSGPIISGQTGRHPLPAIDQLSQTFSQWGIDSQVQVVAYDDKGGAIASRLWWLLRWLDHSAVAVLDGGWQHWQQAEQPVSSDIEARPARPFIPYPQPHLMTTLAEVQANYTNPDFCLLDARAPERYRGEVEPLDAVAGHIPGAVLAPFADNLAADGRFLAPEQLRARFQALFGALPAEKTISYCGSGVTAAHNILAVAHAGLGNVKLYAGSWSEWITQPNCPVETTN